MAVRVGPAGGGSSRKKSDSRFKGVTLVTNQKKRKRRTKTEIKKEELEKEQKQRAKETAKIKPESSVTANVKITERVMASLVHASEERKSVQILYKDTDGKKSRRIVDPYSLKMSEKGLKLMAFCHKRKGIRSFYIRRIQDISVLSISYTSEFDVTVKKDWDIFKTTRAKV